MKHVTKAHSFGMDVENVAPWFRDGLIEQHRTYSVEHPGKDANRVLTGSEYRHENPGFWGLFTESALRPLRLADQMRVVVFDAGRFVAFCGLYRHEHGRRFSERDSAVFQHLLPDVIDSLGTAQLLANVGPGNNVLEGIISAVHSPIFATTEDGRVVFANLAARRAFSSRPIWIDQYASRDALLPAWLHRVEIENNGRRVFVYMPRLGRHESLRPAAATISQRFNLPRSLARLVTHLLEGLTDREIAATTGLAHNTVRTYVRRIYAHLGVSNRMQLAALVHLAGHD